MQSVCQNIWYITIRIWYIHIHIIQRGREVDDQIKFHRTKRMHIIRVKSYSGCEWGTRVQ